MPLNIIIAGAGVAGLTAAIALTTTGHTVTVYEKRDDDDAKGSDSGIQLQPNAVRAVRKFGMIEAIDKVAHNSMWTDIRDHKTGKSIALLDMNRRGGTRYAVRRDLKQAYLDEAAKRGVTVIKGQGVVAVREDGGKPIVELEGGKEVTADLVVGADGTYSRVRRSLYPEIEPAVLDNCVLQVVVPLSFVEQHAETRSLLRHKPATVISMSPGSSVLLSPCLHAGTFDLQAVDLDRPLSKDPQADIRLGWIHDMSYIRERYRDHEPGVRMILEHAQKYYKWRLTEVRGLPSWSSSSGKVVLIGDAAHAMTPYSGQGSAMGIEDAAILTELLNGVSARDGLQSRMSLFEKVRRPRVELVQKFTMTIGRIWSAKEAQFIKKRNAGFSKLNSPRYFETAPDKTAPFGSPAFDRWMDDYDASAEVKRAIEDAAVHARL